MDSYQSEALFLNSLPKPEHHTTLKSLLNHSAQFKGSNRIFQLSQDLLSNIGVFSGPRYNAIVKKCVEILRSLPDDIYGNISYYATHVEECCV